MPEWKFPLPSPLLVFMFFFIPSVKKNQFGQHWIPEFFKWILCPASTGHCRGRSFFPFPFSINPMLSEEVMWVGGKLYRQKSKQHGWLQWKARSIQNCHLLLMWRAPPPTIGRLLVLQECVNKFYHIISFSPEGPYRFTGVIQPAFSILSPCHSSPRG